MFNNNLLMGAGGQSSGGFSIDYAGLFTSGSELSATYSITAPWTFSAWIYLTDTGSENLMLGATAGEIHFNSNDTLEAEGTSTSALHRDTTGWMHVHISNNGIYVNGVSRGSCTTTSLSNQKLFDDFEGYAAEVHLKSGTDAVTNFGEEDSVTGVWVAIAATAGEHYFKFEGDAGTNSGSAGDWTDTSVTLVTNTPTAEMCLFNPLQMDSSSFALSSGNTVATSTSVGGGAEATIPFPRTGQWQITFKSTSTSALASAGVMVPGQVATDWGSLGSVVENTSQLNFCTSNKDTIQNGSYDSYSFTVTTSDEIAYCLDFDANTVKVYQNGGTVKHTFSGSLDADKHWVPFAFVHTGAAANCTIVEEVDLSYPISGYTYLNQANVDVHNAVTTALSDHFVAVTDTETNIASTLSAAHSFTNRVDIYKNYTTSENWIWRFSHDSGNEYSTSSTATYQSVSTLTGTDTWTAWSINIGSASGTAAGSQAHTNGTGDTTVTHSLGEARCAILLFPRSSGEVWFYHPDLTAGDLLQVTGGGAEQLSSNITNVGINSFDIGTGHATDTYDYLVLADGDFIKIMSHVGGGSTYAFINAGVAPEWFWSKHISATVEWFNIDAVTNSNYNVMSDFYAFDLNSKQTSGNNIDFTSKGVKSQNSNSRMNGSGITYVDVIFGTPSGRAR